MWYFDSDVASDHFRLITFAFRIGRISKASMRQCNRSSPINPTHVPISLHQFLVVNSSPSSRPHFFPSCHMTHQSEPARFQILFESALQAYEKRTGLSLAQHPLAIKLQMCHTVEAITSLLQDQAQAFRDLQGIDKIMKSLETTVSILSKLSSAASLADAFGLVRQRALMACPTSLKFIYRHFHLPRRFRLVSLSYLTYVPFSSSYVDGLVTSVIQSAKGIISSCDSLIDLLESIEHFLTRLNIYTRISPTPAMDEIVLKILVELISTLALVTEELKHRRSSKSVLANILLLLSITQSNL